MTLIELSDKKCVIIFHNERENELEKKKLPFEGKHDQVYCYSNNVPNCFRHVGRDFTSSSPVIVKVHDLEH